MHSECILIRAIEPIIGKELMIKRRNKKNVLELSNGPGKLTQALGITKENLNKNKDIQN